MISGIFDLLIITGCIMRVIKKFLTTGVLPEPILLRTELIIFAVMLRRFVYLSPGHALHPPDLKRQRNPELSMEGCRC